MSVSAKPWLADRQPSSCGGVLQVMTGPVPVGIGKRLTIGGQMPNNRAEHRARFSRDAGSLLAQRKHIDLRRMASALCR